MPFRRARGAPVYAADSRIGMAIYHLTAKVISRARGQSITAAAAYRSGAALRDERYGITHHFVRNGGVAHVEIMAPESAPPWTQDRQALWNRVEAGERRKDSQLARAIDIGLPVELSHPQSVALVRDYLAQEFVSKGMIADFCIRRSDPNNPYVQVLLTLREATPLGFGPKMRQWNRKSNLLDWRAAWAERANLHLARAGHSVRIDHRTLEAQQEELTPGRKTGIGAARQGEHSLPGHLKERVAEQRRIARENGATMLQDPTVALRALCRQRPSFTQPDLVNFLRSRTDDAGQLEAVLAAVMGSGELVALAADGTNPPRFTSRDMIEAEKSLMKRAAAMAMRRGHGAPSEPRPPLQSLHELSEDMRWALEYLLSEGDIKVLTLTAGPGKNALLAAARDIWVSQGLQVMGVALSKIAAEHLQSASAIPSQVIAARELEWNDESAALTARHLMVVDGAEMIGLKQLERILAVTDRARAKLVLVGDAQQLAAMGSMSPLRGLLDKVGMRRASP